MEEILTRTSKPENEELRQMFTHTQKAQLFPLDTFCCLLFTLLPIVGNIVKKCIQMANHIAEVILLVI